MTGHDDAVTGLTVVLELPVLMAQLEFEGLRVDDGAAGHDALCACGDAYRRAAEQSGQPGPSAIAGVQHARTLFRALGIDPTKRRPSSEALLQRALKSKPMPRINVLVDVGNWCSLDFLLPLGLYDLDRIEGAVTLRRGRSGEQYETIGNRTMGLEDRYVLADDRGPFGSPITDSVRTSVRVATTSAVVLIYAPVDLGAEELLARAETMSRRVVQCCGGSASVCRLVRPA